MIKPEKILYKNQKLLISFGDENIGKPTTGLNQVFFSLNNLGKCAIFSTNSVKASKWFSNVIFRNDLLMKFIFKKIW